MPAVLAIAFKDLRLLLRDKGALFFTFVFPLFLALLFGLVFGGGGGGKSRAMDIAVFNADNGPASKQFIDDLKADDALAVTEVASRREAEELVQGNKAVAAVVIPEGFEERAGSIFGGRTMEIEGVVDPARSAEAGLLTGKLNEIAFKQMSRSFTDPARMDKVLRHAREDIADSDGLSPATKSLFGAMFDSIKGVTDSSARDIDQAKKEGKTADAPGWRPVDVKISTLKVNPDEPQSAFEISFPQGVVWALAGCVMAFGVSLTEERQRGTLTRLSVAPISRGQVLAGKAVACWIACVVIQALLLAFAMALGARCRAPLVMVAAIAVVAFGFTGLMMLLAGLARSAGAAHGAGRGIVLVLAMIGGGTIPLFAMPSFMATLSNISPFKWAVVLIEQGVWRWTGHPTDLLLPVAVLLLAGVLGYVIGVSAMRWSE